MHCSIVDCSVMQCSKGHYGIMQLSALQFDDCWKLLIRALPSILLGDLALHCLHCVLCCNKVYYIILKNKILILNFFNIALLE